LFVILCHPVILISYREEVHSDFWASSQHLRKFLEHVFAHVNAIFRHTTVTLEERAPWWKTWSEGQGELT
jgi:hypothetical protein